MASDNYDKLYCNIEKLVIGIREKTSQCNPLHLMSYMAMQRKMSSVDELKEIEYNLNFNLISTVVEYFSIDRKSL